jgi:hypothetical protein
MTFAPSSGPASHAEAETYLNGGWIFIGHPGNILRHWRSDGALRDQQDFSTIHDPMALPTDLVTDSDIIISPDGYVVRSRYGNITPVPVAAAAAAEPSHPAINSDPAFAYSAGIVHAMVLLHAADHGSNRVVTVDRDGWTLPVSVGGVKIEVTVAPQEEI